VEDKYYDRLMSTGDRIDAAGAAVSGGCSASSMN
jgi:hypothetical protein